MRIQIPYKKLDPRGKAPEYAHEDDSGADLFTIEGVRLFPGDACIARTGIAVKIPFGYELQVRPRSGLARDFRVSIVNTPGTIDSGYTGEIQVLLENRGGKALVLEAGDRMAQLVLAPVYVASYVEVDELPTTERGEGGFGHTGGSGGTLQLL